MRRVKFSALIAAALAALFVASIGFACSPMGVGKDATADGSVMVAHTCDGWYDNRVIVIPGGTWEEGTMIDIYNDPCTATRKDLKLVGQIPQAAETYTYFQIGYPFMNEKQLMMGEHTWSGRQEMYSTPGEAIMMIANIEAIALARTDNARDAIKVMGAISEEWGYCDGGEALIIGDKYGELWYFEICGPGPLWTKDSGTPGAHWAARRIPDDQFFIAANRSRIGVIDFNDPENYMWSTDLTKMPLEMGWWTEGTEFNYSEIFHPSKSYSWNEARRVWRGLSLAAPSLELPAVTTEPYPWSVKPDQKMTVQDLQKIYRDHLEGTPYDQTTERAAGPFGLPYRLGYTRDNTPETGLAAGAERLINSFGCSYSFISQSRSWMPDPVGGVLWFGEDSPDTCVYVPIYCGAYETPYEWANCNRKAFDQNSAWWAFQFVNNWAWLRWNTIYADIQAEQAKYENAYFANQAVIEEAAIKLYEQDPQLCVEFVNKYTNDCMNALYKGWWEFAWELVAKYSDGKLMVNGVQSTLGMPKWWLEETGHGLTVYNDTQARNAMLEAQQ